MYNFCILVLVWVFFDSQKMELAVMISRLIKMLVSFLMGIKNVFLIEKHIEHE